MARLRGPMLFWNNTSVPTYPICKMTGLNGYRWPSLLPILPALRLPVFPRSSQIMDSTHEWDLNLFCLPAAPPEMLKSSPVEWN